MKTLPALLGIRRQANTIKTDTRRRRRVAMGMVLLIALVVIAAGGHFYQLQQDQQAEQAEQDQQADTHVDSATTRTGAKPAEAARTGEHRT